jgi:nucleotide-binding universal stress UspA family protein
MYAKMLVANDGSVGGQKALTAAIELARQLSAELHMASIEELPRIPASIAEVAEEKAEANRRFAPVIEAAKVQAQRVDMTIETHLVPGHVVEALVRLINAALRAGHRRHHGQARALGAL